MKKYIGNNPLLVVEKPLIGQPYHLSWAQNGCVWTLLSMDKEKGTCLMRTRVTKKEITAKLADLRHTRNQEFKIKWKEVNQRLQHQ